MKRLITKRETTKLPSLKKAAAYARVSSGKDEMLNSLANQISYYSSYIQNQPGWTYAGVYADEAMTGTKDNRPEFCRLIEDCRSGKIELVITKSISRFARNTVDLLETVRELKALGIDVYFEEQNIHSMGGEGELMLTILASYAQEESRSVSENCKWRIRRQFENGELANLRFMFGYNITKDKIEVDPGEAEIVKMIFKDYISGMGGTKIAKKLKDMGVVKPRNGEWRSERVIEIIRNEKYTGNALLQKKYVEDHLTKRLVRNKGKINKYYAEDTHPAIIDEDTFEKAQQILNRRSEYYGAKDNTNNRYPFSSLIECGNCGKKFKRKVRAKNVSWQCSTFLEKGKGCCHAKQIPEKVLYELAEEMTIYNEGIFKKIIVPEPNKLIFVFKDGREIEREWKDRPRSEIWTDEMRQAASVKEKERLRNGC